MSLLLLFAGASSGGVVVEFSDAASTGLLSLNAAQRIRMTSPVLTVGNRTPQRRLESVE